MRRRSVVSTIGVVLAAGLVALAATQLAIALPGPGVPTPSPTVDRSRLPVGSDASWPSCTPPHGTTRTLPLAADPAFAVVGVNDGLPGTRSACIERELAWADGATGGSRPRLEYYVLAADPWTAPELRWVPHPDWPASNLVRGTVVSVPAAYGSGAGDPTCSGAHDPACAYVFGWATALADAALPGLRAPAEHRFWIDVEAVRTWSRDRAFNQAVVEGMVAAFSAPRSTGGVGTTVGLYSTYGEWPRIVGRLRPGSPLIGLDQWLAVGTATEAEAVRVLRRGWPFQPGGRLVLVQYRAGAVDLDVGLPGP